LSLNDVVSDTRNLLSRLIRENIRLVFHLADDLGKVKIDPTQVQQILLNLVLNGRDAMADGGLITIQTKNCPGPAKCGDDSAAGTACLRVTDSRRGRDAGTRSRLLQPCFKTQKTGQAYGLE